MPEIQQVKQAPQCLGFEIENVPFVFIHGAIPFASRRKSGTVKLRLLASLLKQAAVAPGLLGSKLLTLFFAPQTYRASWIGATAGRSHKRSKGEISLP
ncbi:hypothetical protein [Pseudaestuariivita sp.]|uniref:hypothetical protein n=1 Tax=Pseudaestuariivita sp. TaxID=2211669 RepID=UPI0040598557